jgi:voltage-gated potassium channel
LEEVVSPPPRRLPIPLRLLAFSSVPALLIAAGTVGYRITERWAWFDSFYVAVITLTSIGYGDKHAFSIPGRVLTLILALGGITTVAVAATELLSTILTGELREFRWKRRVARRIAGLDQHVIVCGYGHIGRYVCADLIAGGVPVVVIDTRDESLAAARIAGAHPLHGDATTDTLLIQAGIERARALIAVVGTDADNLLVTMAARLLRSDLSIVSCVDEEFVRAKLLRAGATLTVSPHAIAGARIAHAVLRPVAFGLLAEATGGGQGR